MTQEPRLLTVPQVATRLGKSPRTIQRMAISGELPHVQKLQGATGPYVFDAAVVELVARQQEARTA